jgi:hypothetical protein
MEVLWLVALVWLYLTHGAFALFYWLMAVLNEGPDPYDYLEPPDDRPWLTRLRRTLPPRLAWVYLLLHLSQMAALVPLYLYPDDRAVAATPYVFGVLMAGHLIGLQWSCVERIEPIDGGIGLIFRIGAGIGVGMMAFG